MAPQYPRCRRCSSPLMTRHFQLQILRLGVVSTGVARPDRWAVGGQGASDRFDVVFAYAGAHFQVGSFLGLRRAYRSRQSARSHGPGAIPAFRRRLLSKGSVVTRRILDLQLEWDGRVRSTAPLLRLADGRIALGIRRLGGRPKRSPGICGSARSDSPICPDDGHADIQPGDLARLPGIAASGQVRRYVEGQNRGGGGRGGTWRRRHRGHPLPGWRTSRSVHGPVRAAHRTCSNGRISTTRQGRSVAIQSAASERPVSLAPKWLRLIAGAGLTPCFCPPWLFGTKARWHSASATSRQPSILFVQLARSVAFGLVGPVLFGCLMSVVAFIFANIWLPMGYPILVTISAFAAIVGIRISPPWSLSEACTRPPLFAARSVTLAWLRRSTRRPQADYFEFYWSIWLVLPLSPTDRI